jgi:hypothetical protein
MINLKLLNLSQRKLFQALGIYYQYFKIYMIMEMGVSHIDIAMFDSFNF